MAEEKMNHRDEAVIVLKEDAKRILQLIKVQMDNLTLPQCPAYEEVLDTQMYGLSREINFAVRLGLIEQEEGKKLLQTLEKELSTLHELSMNKQ
ncbi:YlaN family protein [Listeria costaricensis]|uniref:YlaN family protein n=1 Tax=Listeria costaricensis TaxID=2026604 RepID=UPI000C07E3BE|nr:YlaN family protein [Listeria costaricensis]